MSKKSPRFKFVLVEQPGTELTLYQRPPRRYRGSLETKEDLFARLLRQSLLSLKKRSTSGGTAWTVSLHDDPLAFLLDSMSDAWTLRDGQGELLFASDQATAWGLEQSESSALFEQFEHKNSRYERRGLKFSGLTLELIRRL